MERDLLEAVVGEPRAHAGVASGGRRWRVQITCAPGAHNVGEHVDRVHHVGVGDVAEHAAHEHEIGRHRAAYDARRRPRRRTAPRCRPARAPGRVAASSGSSSTSRPLHVGAAGMVARARRAVAALARAHADDPDRARRRGVERGARCSCCTIASRRGERAARVGRTRRATRASRRVHRPESSHDISRDPVGNRARRQGGDQGRARPSRARARRLLGAQRRQGRPGRRRDLRHRPDRRDARRTASTRSARSTPTRSSTRRCMASTRDVIRLLESGKNVVTPVGWIYPGRHARRRRARRPRASRASVDAARHRHQSRRHHRAVPADAVGAVPRHPPRARRGVLRHPQLPDRAWSSARSCCSARTPETAAKSPMIEMLGHGFMQSIDMVAAELGLDARRREDARSTRWRSRPVDIDTPVGVIEKGTVAAQRFTWEGTVDGEPVITVRVNWLMGDGEPRPAVDARRAALRGRVRRRRRRCRARSTACTRRSSASTPRSVSIAPGDALRERDPVRRARPSPASRRTSTCRSSRAAPRPLTISR